MSRAISVSPAAAKKVHTLSEDLQTLCDGVLQSKIFVDGHCVRQVRASRHVQEQDSLDRNVPGAKGRRVSCRASSSVKIIPALNFIHPFHSMRLVSLIASCTSRVQDGK